MFVFQGIASLHYTDFTSHLVVCLYLVYCSGITSSLVYLQIITISMNYITKVTGVKLMVFHNFVID